MGDLVSNHLELPCVVASRGRNPDNPKSRKSGLNTEQQLELNRDGVSNCVTTVAKDNWIIEPMVLKKERTVIGKKFRKQYESKEISMNRKEISKSVPRTDGCTNTITTVQKDNYLVEPVDAQVMVAGNYTKCGHESDRVVQPDGISPTVKENHGRVITIPDDTANSKLKYVGSIGDYDRVGDGKKLSRNSRTSDRVYDVSGVSATITASSCGLAGHAGGLYVDRVVDSVKDHSDEINCSLDKDLADKESSKTSEHTYPFRLRKLTPKECWRLQGFDDEDIDKCSQAGVTDSQLYIQAGNTIAVNCLCAIFQNLLGTPCDSMPTVDVESRLF